MVLARLASDHALTEATAQAVDAVAAHSPSTLDWAAIHVDAPRRERVRQRVYERRAPGETVVPAIDYLAREARNASLGAAGEEFVLQFEHARLGASGANRLADRVERVSRTRGDGLGYDILSFEADGRERLIEVKTTRFGPMTPFFASSNEVEFSSTRAEHYHLYRVFRFERAPKLFWLSGSLRQSVVLQPASYRASLPDE